MNYSMHSTTEVDLRFNVEQAILFQKIRESHLRLQNAPGTPALPGIGACLWDAECWQPVWQKILLLTN